MAGASVEVQDEEPRVREPLSVVGFKGVRVRVRLDTPEGPLALDLTVNAYVSIRGDRRGAHLSRNIEALAEALETGGGHRSIEEYLAAVADRLLARHPYADRAIAEARATLFTPVDFHGIKGVEPVEARVAVEKPREGPARWTVEATVYGMSVCPSAMSTVREILGSLEGGVAPSHSQKVRVTGGISSTKGFARIEDVARALLSAPSAPALTLLKRGQEARLVIEAHRNPKLAEDIARDALSALKSLARRLGLPPDTRIHVEVESMESIHPHNVYVRAEAVAGLDPGPQRPHSPHQ